MEKKHYHFRNKYFITVNQFVMTTVELLHRWQNIHQRAK